MDRKRLFKLLSFLALAGGLSAALPLAQRWPRDQTIHYVLGDAAGRLTELDAVWQPAAARPATAGSGAGDGDELAREARFQFESGRAPRIVTHTPRLPDGDYTVEIDLVSPQGRSAVTRRVALSGGATSIDLVSAVPR